MASDIRKKIRALLAMASDASATDNERAVAMEKAQALIEKYNVELGDEEDFADKIEIRKGDIFAVGLKLPYHKVVAAAVARLYEARHLMWDRGAAGHSFWGMSHQVEAAEETFLWIIAQIEDLYRTALKAFDGRLTKQQRAELRASFKDAAAVRVAHRIDAIITARREKRDSRALVVVNVAAEKLEEEMKDIKKAKPIALRNGFGTGAGYNAGGLVKIQKDVSSRDVLQSAADEVREMVLSGHDLEAAIRCVAEKENVDPDALRARYEMAIEDVRRIA